MFRKKRLSFNVRSYYLTRPSRASQKDKMRKTWSNKSKFVLTCFIFSVGFGSIYRFPTSTFNSEGGGAFLIVYTVAQILIGIPTYFLELSLGQYSGKGFLSFWEICPAARGIGISMFLCIFMQIVYYNIIVAYSGYHIVACLRAKLPWVSCDKEWIQNENCTDADNPLSTCDETSRMYGYLCECSGYEHFDFNESVRCPFPSNNLTGYEHLAEIARFCPNIQLCTNYPKKPSRLYFYHTIAESIGRFTSIGYPNLYICSAVFFVIIFVFLIQIRKLRSRGKILYTSRITFYFVMLVFLCSASLNEGSLNGLKYFLKPKLSDILKISIWKQATSQMFFSLGIGVGGLITLGSFSPFRNNLFYDTLALNAVIFATNGIVGFVVFSTYGSLKKETKSLTGFQDYGFPFVIYSDALSRLFIPHAWSLVFYAAIFVIGIDGEVTLLEIIITELREAIPYVFKYNLIATICLGILFFLVTLPLCTPSGLHILMVIDHYGFTNPILILVTLEMVTYMWVYGVGNIIQDLRYMLIFDLRPTFLWKFIWSFLSIAFVSVIFIWSLCQRDYMDKEYRHFNHLGVYIGYGILSSILLPVPVYFIRCLMKSEETTFFRRIKDITGASEDWIPRPHDA